MIYDYGNYTCKIQILMYNNDDDGKKKKKKKKERTKKGYGEKETTINDVYSYCSL